jgi:FtsH-binding integral membrane protein
MEFLCSPWWFVYFLCLLFFFLCAFIYAGRCRRNETGDEMPTFGYIFDAGMTITCLFFAFTYTTAILVTCVVLALQELGAHLE